MDETPFSFHCMICFEEFDPEIRYPVVLPCGHTYVCSACSERLDKCMECRTPLYTIVPKPPSEALSPTRWSSSRTSRSAAYGSANQPPPQPPIKKRLPLPKNVVLLSLIEATALASENVRPKALDSPRDDAPPREKEEEGYGIEAIRTMGSIVDDDDDEEKKIQFGASLAGGVAGTYAVAVKEGLEIFPAKPKASMDDTNTLANADVDKLVRFHHKHQDPRNERGMDPPTGDSANYHEKLDTKPQLHLSYGDRVQIVSVDKGWAKLSRGYGFVRAERNSLVKVGNAVDRACKLEAILRNLSQRKKELRIEQSNIDNHFIRMMNNLQASLQNDEDLTVIVADAFSTGTDEDLTSSERTGEDVAIAPAAAAATAAETTTSPRMMDEISRQKAENRAAAVETDQECPPNFSPFPGRLTCFAGSVFDPDPLPELSSSNTMIEQFNSSQRDILPTASHPSASAMRAGAQAWRDRHRQQARSGVDFRTGMSGHHGVMGNYARHPHEYLSSSSPSASSTTPSSGNPVAGNEIYRPSSASRSYQQQNAERPMRMSSHRGLTTSFPGKDSLQGLLGSLTQSILMPREESRDQVQRTGTL